MIRKLALPILFVALLIWTACGGGTTAGGSSDNPPGTVPTPTPTPVPTPTPTPTPAPPQTPSACAAMSTGQLSSLNGFRPFATDSPWNTDISQSPVDANSAAIINYIGSTIGLHADFGSGLYNGSNIGIPYVIVDGTQAGVNITAQYSDESDPRTDADSGECADRRLSESGERRPACAGARQRELFSL